MKSAFPATAMSGNEAPVPGVDQVSPPGEANFPAQLHEHLVRRVLAAAVAFLCAWVVVNRSIFSQVTQDSGDTATILLQVYNAKRFHELLGNYSRWHFHHPGPAFIYILALGDAIFRDLLHLVPAPANSAALTLLLLYTFLLFATIFLFQRESRSPWFLPGAVAATLWFIYVVDRTFPGSASGGIWMPYIIMPCFLLFVAACASLAIGNSRHLPLAILCGGLLIHGHVAQLLFVGVLLSVALLFWLVPPLRRAGLGPTLRLYRAPLLISFGIVLLFLFPVLLEAVLDHPSNLHNLNAYLRQHRGPQNSWPMSWKYVFSLVVFLPDPEVALLKPDTHLFAHAVGQGYVLAYWGAFLTLLAAAVATRVARSIQLSPFLRYMAFELALIVVLVGFWARKIAGGLFAFNAYFFFATFLLASFVLLAYLCDAWTPARESRWSVVVACLLPFLMLAAPPEFHALEGISDQARETEIKAIVPNIPNNGKRVFISWPDNDDWALATGIASWLQDHGRPFCVGFEWPFMFPQGEDCHDVSGLQELELVRPPYSCRGICRVIFEDDRIVASIDQFEAYALPFDLRTDSPGLLATDFYGIEGEHGPMWSKRYSTVQFLLSDQWNPTPTVRMIVRGMARAGDPVVIALNGHPVGTIDHAGWVAAEFKVPESYFRPGDGNRLSFTTDRAGPAGKDLRTLGFYLSGIQFFPE